MLTVISDAETAPNTAREAAFGTCGELQAYLHAFPSSTGNEESHFGKEGRV